MINIKHVFTFEITIINKSRARILKHLWFFLDYERSDECIDFTIMFVFLYLCTAQLVEIMLQFQTSGVVFEKSIYR